MRGRLKRKWEVDLDDALREKESTREKLHLPQVGNSEKDRYLFHDSIGKRRPCQVKLQ